MLIWIPLAIVEHFERMRVYELRTAPETRCANVRPHSLDTVCGHTVVTLIARASVQALAIRFKNFDHSLEPVWAAKVRCTAQAHHHVAWSRAGRELIPPNVHP